MNSLKFGNTGRPACSKCGVVHSLMSSPECEPKKPSSVVSGALPLRAKIDSIHAEMELQKKLREDWDYD